MVCVCSTTSNLYQCQYNKASSTNKHFLQQAGNRQQEQRDKYSVSWRLFLRMICAAILTVLKLDLNFQILPEQVHHHRLHVPSDATAIPVGNKTVFLVRHTKWTHWLHQELKSVGEVTESRSDSLLHQLHNALCVHEEDFSLGFLVQSGSVAVEDVCNLKSNKWENKSIHFTGKL